MLFGLFLFRAKLGGGGMEDLGKLGLGANSSPLKVEPCQYLPSQYLSQMPLAKSFPYRGFGHSDPTSYKITQTVVPESPVIGNQCC